MSLEDEVNAQRAESARAASKRASEATAHESALERGQAELRELIVEAFDILVHADAPRAIATSISTTRSYPWSSKYRFRLEGRAVGFFLPKALTLTNHVILTDGRLCRADEFSPYRGNGLGSVPRESKDAAPVVEKFRRDHAPDKLVTVGDELKVEASRPSSYGVDQFFVHGGQLVFGGEGYSQRPAREMFAAWVARALDG